MAAETCIIANAHTGKPVLHKVVTETITVAIRKAAGAANGCRIQGIWDRRQIRANLKQALLTIGGRNLYYR